MAERKDPCDEARLRILLYGDERSDEFRESASHVETCVPCQNHLTRLAAEEGTWTEVCELLRGYPERTHSAELPTCAVSGREWRPVTQSGGQAGDKPDFLSAPSHPEMLGRLGRYEIERVIGSGGMGVVLKGFDTELNRPVAIKVLARHLAHCGAARQRFAREARAAAAIVHEHVVAIHNVESDAEVPFLVMQYVAGESLQARVDRQGPLGAKELIRIGIQAAAGLAAAHDQGVVHRDVKPGNILLESGVERVLLTDFGLARTVDDASLTYTGIVAGTPHYMSPEQANGEVADHRTDLFSLGAVLFFMATGRPPFRAERAMGVLHRICHDRHRPVWEVNPEMPDELSDVIDRLLEKKPDRRFANAGQVKQALSQTLARLQQPRMGPRAPGRRFVRRHQRWLLPSAMAIAITATAAVLIASGVFTTPVRNDANDKSTASVVSNQPSASADAAEYPAALRDIENRLLGLKSALEESSYLHLPDSDWSIQLELIHFHLDRLQDDPIGRSLRPQLKGDEP